MDDSPSLLVLDGTILEQLELISLRWSSLMLNGVMLLWFTLTAFSVAYVAADIYRTPESPVLKWAFILLTAYTGPVGAFLYVLGCREPLPGLHERYTEARWRQVLGSTMHCVAGDGAGILVGAILGAFLKFSGGVDITIEYILGFGFGWSIFQALFMKNSMGGSYKAALKKTFIPELVSMNILMAAFIPVMEYGFTHASGSHNPTTPAFWFIMSMGLLFGFIIDYPINWWLVSHHLKHGMATIRPAGQSSTDMKAVSKPGKAKMEDKAEKVESVSRGVQLRMVGITFGLLALSIISVVMVGWL
jgi:hypothetical protein